MKDYKRLITRGEKGEWMIELNEELKMVQHNLPEDEFIKVLFNLTAQRLCDFEDKIENGTLVELPTTDKDILENYAHKIFDSWNDITGAVNKNCSWYYEALWVIDDIVGMVWGITSRQYEAKLRELKEKDNE